MFLDISKTRKILSLHGEWTVHPANSDKIEKVRVEIPSSFEGESELVFEKSFTLTFDDVVNHKLRLNFLGLNYSADISLNKISIYRHAGGEFPFSLELPRDILHSDKANILSVRLSNYSDSKNTIPVKQKFHFPKSGGGIFRDVYISFTPNVFISEINPSVSFDQKSKKYFLTVKTKIENREFRTQADTIGNLDQFSFLTSLNSPSQETILKSVETKFQLSKNSETYLTQTFELTSSMLWSPAYPKTYLINTEIFRGESLIDKTTRSIAPFKLEIINDSLALNNQDFSLSGVTHYPVFEDYGGLISYSQMEKDIKLIKQTGFNAIRFAKKIPHPYLLFLCQTYGLLPFVEIPVNSIPTSILNKEEFYNRTANYLNFFLKGFKNYFIAAIGLGGGYSGDSEDNTNFVQNLATIVKKNSNALVFASFKDERFKKINNLDLYGIEVINKPINESNLDQLLKDRQITPGRIFISEATYLASRGKSDGYLYKNSYEAQAKFFEDVIDYSNSYSLRGYFLNSMFDYRSQYASIIAGYNEESLLSLGLANEDRNTDRIGYKVIYAKLNKAEKITIPIGSTKDDSPMLFIITGILLAIVMGIMINSGKKFREDSSRALLRPYNFFADIRDQRLISSFHTLVILLIIAVTSGLLLSNVLYFLKENIRFEKILLSFGKNWLMQDISWLSWNPLASIGWLSVLTIIKLFLLIIIIKVASFFVKTRVALSSVFHTVIWSFLPLVLLVPVGIILYRVLSINLVNFYLFIGLIVFTIWIFHRLLKGIYVIFDTNPSNVYLYTVVILLIIAITFIFYIELKNSSFTYILYSLKGYKLLG